MAYNDDMKQRASFRILLLTPFVVGISLLHYPTPLHLPILHDIFQRLNHIPISLGVFWFDLRGGVAAAVVTSILTTGLVLATVRKIVVSIPGKGSYGCANPDH